MQYDVKLDTFTPKNPKRRYGFLKQNKDGQVHGSKNWDGAGGMGGGD